VGEGTSALRLRARRGRALLLGTLVLGAAVLTVVFSFAESKPMYARSVSEFLRQPMRDTRVRLQGFLVRGSLCKEEATCNFRFRLTDSPSEAAGDARPELEVNYAGCIVPDNLRDEPGLEVEVGAEGELCADCAYFEATHLITKCPSKYEMASGGMHALPRVPIRPCASPRLERR
jgi:cytochrome c-type biogenesis protein CcmE